MIRNKETVTYEGKDPFGPRVRYVAIQTEAQPPYVWATYINIQRRELPELGADLKVMPIEEAMTRFEFQKGSLADVVSK